MASVVRTQTSPEQQFSNWAWETSLKLHLHSNSQPHPILGAANQEIDIPDLNTDPKLHTVLKSVKANDALASYVALVMTKHGHR